MAMPLHYARADEVARKGVFRKITRPEAFGGPLSIF
jgi:hypothetical protein